VAFQDLLAVRWMQRRWLRYEVVDEAPAGVSEDARR
jgi:hypothetical protein